MIVDDAHAVSISIVRAHRLKDGPQGAMSRGCLRSAAFVAAAATLLMFALPASAQHAVRGSESRKLQHAPSGSAPDQSWAGLSTDFGVSRPINSHVTITNGTTEYGPYNLTGILFTATAAYLYQEGHFVLGPRTKLAAGWIESMPLDYTIRTNAILTVGGEAGVAVGRSYSYLFGGGGGAWLSAKQVGVGQADNVVPAYELGAGFRYGLSQRWYAKVEFSYTTLGDNRLGDNYINPKPYFGYTAGFGFQFTPK